MNTKNLVLLGSVLALLLVSALVAWNMDEDEHTIKCCTNTMFTKKDMNTRTLFTKDGNEFAIRGRYIGGNQTYYSYEFIDIIPLNQELWICYSDNGKMEEININEIRYVRENYE